MRNSSQSALIPAICPHRKNRTFRTPGVPYYNKTKVHEIYPEYWVIKTGKFRNRVNNKLDEWIYFLKNAEIKPNFSAKGLKEANEKLDAMKLPEKELKAYNAYLRHLMSIASRNHNIEIDAKEIIRKAKEEKKSKRFWDFMKMESLFQ